MTETLRAHARGSSPGGGGTTDLAQVARFMVHALRTPLAALAGEAELALRRDRTPEAYREVLLRMSRAVADLTALTEDLAILSCGSPAPSAGEVTSIEQGVADLDVECDPEASKARVIGNPDRIGRALALLVAHAHQYHDSACRLRFRRARELEQGGTGADVVLELDAAPPGLSASAWQHLGATAVTQEEVVDGGAYIRLRTAMRIVEDCGGRLDVHADESGARVRMRFERARD